MQERYYECSGCGNFSLLNSPFVPDWGVWVLDMLCQNPGLVSSAAQGTVSFTRQEPQKGPFFIFKSGPNKILKRTWWLCFSFGNKWGCFTKWMEITQDDFTALWILVRSVESLTQTFSGGSSAVQYARKDQHQSLLRRGDRKDFHVCSQILMMSGATHSYSALGFCLHLNKKYRWLSQYLQDLLDQVWWFQLSFEAEIHESFYSQYLRSGWGWSFIWKVYG